MLLIGRVRLIRYVYTSWAHACYSRCKCWRPGSCDEALNHYTTTVGNRTLKRVEPHQSASHLALIMPKQRSTHMRPDECQKLNCFLSSEPAPTSCHREWGGIMCLAMQSNTLAFAMTPASRSIMQRVAGLCNVTNKKPDVWSSHDFIHRLSLSKLR